MEAAAEATRPPTKEEIVDLRRRVLANEPVSDEELKAALAAMCRSIPDEAASKTRVTTPKVKIDVMALLRQRLEAKGAGNGN